MSGGFFLPLGGLEKRTQGPPGGIPRYLRARRGGSRQIFLLREERRIPVHADPSPVALDVHLVRRDLDPVRSVVAHDLPGLLLREPGGDVRIFLFVVGLVLAVRPHEKAADQENAPEQPAPATASLPLVRQGNQPVVWKTQFRLSSPQYPVCIFPLDRSNIGTIR